MVSPLVVIQAFAHLSGTDKKRQGPTGRIVNISFSVAKVAIPLLGASSASKFGLGGMLDALRREQMLFGIDIGSLNRHREHGDVRQGRKRRFERVQAERYWKAVQIFQKFIVTEVRLIEERLGEAVHIALSTTKPKTRYAVIAQRFKNWTLPRRLPARMLDAESAKQMKLRKLLSDSNVRVPTSHDKANLAKTVFRQQPIATKKPTSRYKSLPTVSVFVFMHSSIWPNHIECDSSLSGRVEWVGNRILTFATVYLIGREPVMRMSTSLLALCCQSGPDAT
jgi:hypothetical protein